MQNKKSIITIGLVVVGSLALLFGLAKLGTRSPNLSDGTSQSNLEAPVNLTDHVKGPENAPVTLVEYSDFQCPACLSVQPTIKRLLSEYDQELRLVYRHFPLKNLHKNAEAAARAAEAAAIQDKFWEYHDILFNTQEKWSAEKDPEKLFIEYAISLGLDETRFRSDYTKKNGAGKVESDIKTGEKANVRGTPTFFLNGKYLETPKTYEGFSAAIVEQLILTGNNEVGTNTVK